MHEILQFGTGFPAYRPNLLQRQFPGKYDTLESQFIQKFHPFRIVIMHLCTGMQGYRRQIQLQQTGILHNQRIHPQPVHLFHQPFGLRQFLVVQYRIQRHEHPAIKTVSVIHHPGQVFQRIAGRLPRPKRGAADIHGIRPVVDGSDRHFCVSGR